MTIAGIVIALAVVVTAGVVVVRTLIDDEGGGTRLEQALRLSPPDTQRLSWTDWTGVRREVGLDLTATSPAAAVEDLLDRGFETDLSASSALGSSAVVMQERLGFSPATLDWELFSQGEAVATLAMKAGPEVDFDVVASSLREADYAEPDEPDGAWFSDPDTATITSQVTPQLIFIALDPEESMIFASDSSAGVRAAVAAQEAAESEILPPEVVDATGEPLSASLYTGAQACNALALARADATEVEAGEALIAAAGTVNPLTGFSIATYDDASVRVVMSFETEEQARTNAETRAALASGPAPGQGGDFEERFELDSTTATGTAVVLELTPREGAYVMSDLSSGPVLFATC